MNRRLSATHGVVCRLPTGDRSYFGWPTVARLDDGTLFVASSGLRNSHVCPWGKTVLQVSHDDGASWSAPRVIHDSPLDDRDAGIVALGGDRLLVSWFSTDNRYLLADPRIRARYGDEEIRSWLPTLDALTDADVRDHLGAWVMVSEDRGLTWGDPIRMGLTSPHGPIRLRNGELLYLGKPFGDLSELHDAMICAYHSRDDGRTWQPRGRVPLLPGTVAGSYHEAHVVELPDGKLLGAIRLENSRGPQGDVVAAGYIHFSTLLTESDDGGMSWTMPRSLGYGAPPHLLRHSSGVLVLTYGNRGPQPGQRAGLSWDEGRTWEWDWVIRDDGPDPDLGYPSTVELGDGSLFTVYYQRAAVGEPCSLLWSRWQLPAHSPI